jgi:hypothetical protein
MEPLYDEAAGGNGGGYSSGGRGEKEYRYETRAFEMCA